MKLYKDLHWVSWCSKLTIGYICFPWSYRATPVWKLIFFHFSDAKPNVTILKIPDHDVIYTEDSVSLSCQINISSGWEFLWFKDDHQFAESTSNHTVKSAVTGNSGAYGCKVKRGSSTVFESESLLTNFTVKGVCLCVCLCVSLTLLYSLYVHMEVVVIPVLFSGSPERPMAHVSLLTGWSEVFSTDSLVLQCEVETTNEWNYTW